MHYGTIKKTDIANGVGVRVSLFVSGCRRHCKNCFNPETWNFAYGTPFTEQSQAEILQALAPGYISGLSILGGEPFERENQHDLLPLVRAVKQAYPEKSIWCYTGYVLEADLLNPAGQVRSEDTDALLSCIDVLVDGPFIEEQKDISLRFRGSRNQRLLDLPKTLAAGTPVWWDDAALFEKQ